MEEIILNHDEAEQLAHIKKGESNLARCYIDALDVLRNLVADCNRYESNNNLSGTWATLDRARNLLNSTTR